MGSAHLANPWIHLTGQLACQILILDSRGDIIMDCIACIDKTTTGPVSPPPRY